MRKSDFVKDGCYAVVEAKNSLEYVFRKFDNGALCVGVVMPTKNDKVDFVMIPPEIMEVIKNAPPIKVGDGHSPQLLAEDLIDDTK